MSRPRPPQAGPDLAAVLTPQQVHDARLLLGWTRYQLASRSEVGQHVIAAFESSGHVPSNTIRSHDIRAQRLALIRQVLEEAGVEFTNAGGEPGVRLRAGGRSDNDSAGPTT